MTKKKPQKQLPAPPHQQWFTERAKFYNQLTVDEEKAFAELFRFTQEATASVNNSRDDISNQVNEYERHFTGYFTLAISFIIGGLLSNQLPNVDNVETFAARFLFTTTIVIALTSALVLFAEYVSTLRFFNRWQKIQEEIAAYINKHGWQGPDDLNQWITEKQRDVPAKATHVFQTVEMILLTLAFTSLVLWVVEKFFNPNWPIF